MRTFHPIMLAIAGKDGNVQGIDRESKQVVFKTAGTTLANTGPVDESLKLVAPGAIGGAQWNRTAYDPRLGILYTGMVDWPAYLSTKDYAFSKTDAWKERLFEQSISEYFLRAWPHESGG